MATIAPTRARTDPSSPDQTKKPDRTHLHQRLHSNSLLHRSSHPASNPHHHHHSYRQQARETVQSAIELKPPISFDHLLRRDKNAESSRRNSGTGPGGKEAEEAAQKPEAAVQQHQQQQQQQGERKAPVVRAEDVAAAKRANARRDEELRASLQRAEEVGMSRTRQLDDTYYSILEKATVVRSTLVSLQQLADEVQVVHRSFDDEAATLERDTGQTVGSFAGFEQQEAAIEELVEQLRDSRRKTEVLNDRLESARLRVEGYEVRQGRKEAKRKRRWYLAWACLVAVGMLVLAVLLARNRRAVGRKLDVVGHRLAKVGDAVEEIALPVAAKLKLAPSEDPYLQRLFGEL